MARPVDRRLRDIQALDLVSMGASYRQAAQQLGCSESTAFRAVERELARTAMGSAEKVRRFKLRCLDRALMAIFPAVLRGNLAAINTMLSIFDRQARFLGLDAPVRIDVRAQLLETAARLNLPDEERDALLAEADLIVREAQRGHRR